MSGIGKSELFFLSNALFWISGVFFGLRVSSWLQQRPAINRPLLCVIWGHKLNAEATYFYGIDHCDRCRRDVAGQTGAREWLKVRLYFGRQWIGERIKGFVSFWLPCPECGKRFGKHDDAVDHLPF